MFHHVSALASTFYSSRDSLRFLKIKKALLQNEVREGLV